MTTTKIIVTGVDSNGKKIFEATQGKEVKDRDTNNESKKRDDLKKFFKQASKMNLSKLPKKFSI